MNRTITLASMGVALVLSACSGNSDGPEPDNSSAAVEAPVETVSRVGEGAPPPAPDGAAEAPVSEETAPAAEIPEQIRGRWGLVPKDCTSNLGDAKGLLTISAKQLKFYESVAKLGPIKEADETRIRATFDYSGEGQSWTQDVVLEVQDDGKTLIRRDYGQDALPGPLKYTRCT
ncbi:hypothetical protein [Novosphingobium sp. M1R2S20]|uniref:Lipoprotein n=1 Tax=Novosphingobium rhizovicinum TaxID=3228928 RepID=A0ABV3RF87_9SPHN